MPNKCDDVARLKRLEQMLDGQFRVLGFRFGYDGLIGLVPVAGDIVAAGIGFYVILEARRLGASRWTMARMLTNLGVDVSIGAIPLVGDLFDFAFRSNTKNVRMLIRDLEHRAGELREANRGVQQLKAKAAA
jgi:hypothetical protein